MILVGKMCSTLQYFSKINSYKHPPQSTCTLEELEKYCRERLLLYLLFLEAESMKLTTYTKEWITYIKKKIKENSLETYITLLSDNSDNVATCQALQRDLISHWMLSLCKS